jgi:uncharacterized protein YndB with AHSA1/START domain
MDEIIHRLVILACNPKKAFEMFTVNSQLEKWLTVSADVEPKEGGKYELFWNTEDKDNDSTIGCKVLAISPDKFLTFEWKGPKQFKHFMNNVRPLTDVTVFFIPRQGSTEVHLIHTGWRDTPEWEEARQWFVRNWEDAFAELNSYVASQRKTLK